MPELDDLSRRLTEAQRQREEARLALFRSTEAGHRLEAEAVRLERHFDEERPADRARREELDRRSRQVAAAIEVQQVTLAQASDLAESLAAEFLPLTDPREQLGAKRSDLPVLLLPLRLETRFKTVTLPGGGRSEQLWVRAYPDECMVDTFEDLPAEGELRSTEKFWVDWVAAGGDQDQQRGAWKGLASTSGSGRAAWLLTRHAPEVAAVFPTKADPADLILVVATRPPVPGPEKPAVAAYWTASWRAADAAEQAAADTALEDALGAARAAEIRSTTAPANLATPPAAGRARAEVSVQVAFLELPDPLDTDVQRIPWSQAPRVRVLPERLVLLGYRDGVRVLERLGNVIPFPLIAGPDPLADPADQLRLEDGDVVVGEAMRWMVDFDEAVRVGMGFRVDLSAADLDGRFDELAVVGARLGADEAGGAALLQELLAHHQNGTAGFSLLPQGTATNNTEQAGSGFSETEDADDSFDLVFGSSGALVRERAWLARPDAQWLADMLGIDLATFDQTLHARGRDQAEARAMNTALWPATWGYLMETMLAPVFDAATIEHTRWFFNHFVVARGTIPAVRVGDQPYGILPTTVFSRMRWLADDGFAEPSTPAPPSPGTRAFLAGLAQVLARMRDDWAALVSQVAHVGGPGDPHQVLLDVVGLHGSSVEFHQRYAETLDQLTNRMRLEGFLGDLIPALIALDYTGNGMALLARLGYTGDQIPELLEKLFLDDAFKLLGELIDDQPLSEEQAVRAYTDDGRNYLQWLADAARASYDTLRRQDGFSGGQPPSALLYLLLRYALEQGYWDASLRLYEQSEALTGERLRLARLDPSFVHVAEPDTDQTPAEAVGGLPTSGKPVRLPQRSESRYEFLYRREPAVTGSDELLVADFVAQSIGTALGTRHLSQQLRALDQLIQTPTARLERLLAEHLDLCSYRLDAWRAGLVTYQLAGMRYGGRPGPEGGRAPTARPGVHLGAFGWLTDVRSEGKRLTPVELPEDLEPVFNPPNGPELPPLVRDDSNGGFVHAPSLNHATAAAVLRNGYLANATPESPDTLKVNLSSERVRAALGVIEGIRAGQKLGALLGYQLERGLHDRHDQAEVDKFIFDLRKAFPLVADKLTDTASEDADPIDAVEARNVVDGYALISHIKATGAAAYPFGKQLEPATPAEAAVIDAEVDRIRDLQDAVADLAMSEGIYQTVLGNVDRVASTLDAYSQGNFPPDPEVAQGPRSGINLTHRMGLHLEPGLDPSVSPNGLDVTPRARVEPAVNAWLSGLLPDPAAVFCKASYLDPADGAVKTADVTQADLGLQPLDLLHLVNPQADQAMAALDDQIVHHVLTTFAPRWDGDIRVDYTAREQNRFSLFELGALLRPLRSLLLKSRPLTAADVSLPNETSGALAQTVVVDPARLTGPAADLAEVVDAAGAADDLTTLAAEMAPLLDDPVAHRDDILASIDTWIARAMALLVAASRFAVPGAGSGFAYDWKKRTFARALALVLEVAGRWQGRLDAFTDLVDVQLPQATTDEQRLELLRRAEAQVSTTVTAPLPPDPDDYLTVVQAERDDFAAKLDELLAVTTSPTTEVSALLQAAAATLPLDEFESQGLDLAPVEDEVLRFAAELAGRIALLSGAIGQRAAATEELIAAAAAAATPTEAARTLVEAAKALLGDDFRIVPEFELAPEQGAEWAKAFADRALLLGYLTDPPPAGLGVDHPVDDWLYGVARVRDAARDWERVVMLVSAFRTGDPELTPIQLPYRADDRWLGLPYPDGYPFDGERLLYTAHYQVPFDPAARQCGLLLDDWTEVIPKEEETTGIAFNYDRPSAEPPQAMLLVTSPQMAGPWRWDDLVDAVRETFAEARLRAVEPTQVDGTDYARLLPATLSAVTLHPITIMLDLAMNNRVDLRIEASDG
ncbi:MAG TPA: hypothetical protein VHO93_17060 [Actinomycetota bacterium]|nr:hypothetical protein [Actinomycetota bacterium]